MNTLPLSRIACLTPAGCGALATVGLHGPLAWEAARQLFRTRSGSELPSVPQSGRFWLSRPHTEIADEVVLAVKQIEPVPWLEAHCHGGHESVRLLIELFHARGLNICSWDEFLQHTENDPLRSAASAALARASTVRTAAILLDQYQGAFAAAIHDILASLDRGDQADTTSRLDALARYVSLGRHLTVPWQVTVAGAPNVGKSSLVNALAGYQRSIVAPTPGTTRDVVTTMLAVDGWPIDLTDTAGVRTGAEELEEAGIRRAREAASKANLCLWVLDLSAEPVWPEESLGEVRLIVNKIDLPPAWDLSRAEGAICVSAQTGEGLPQLCSALSRWLVPEPPSPGMAVPFTERLCDEIEETQRQLAAGRVKEARSSLERLLPL